MSEKRQEEMEEERLKYDKMSIRQECLRRSIETCAHAIKTLGEFNKGHHHESPVDDGAITKLSKTLTDSNEKLQSEIQEMK